MSYRLWRCGGFRLSSMGIRLWRTRRLLALRFECLSHVLSRYVHFRNLFRDLLKTVKNKSCDLIINRVTQTFFKQLYLLKNTITR